MKSLQGKSGLLVIACLTVLVIAGSLMLKKAVVTPKPSAAKTNAPTANAPAATANATAAKTSSGDGRLAVKFVPLVVDPYSRPMPGDEAVREQIPNGLSLSGVSTGPTRTVPTDSPQRLDLGPLRIQPPPLEGTLPDSAPTNPGGGNALQTPVDEPIATPVRIGVRGVVGTNADRAFIAVAGGSPRAARAGTDLGDGISVVRVSEQGVVVRRGSQTKTIPVGKEIEL
ncbi:MAG: hypothetical protein KF812_03775 [Fimbriimonadaceae bacterium]|nr:hypothetical protein [Fimbriimonadaceae bacterium]